LANANLFGQNSAVSIIDIQLYYYNINTISLFMGLSSDGFKNDKTDCIFFKGVA